LKLHALNRFNQARQILQNMGLRYVLFRLWFVLQKKIGILKRRFPLAPSYIQFTTLDNWKNLDQTFFIGSRNEINIPKLKSIQLQQEAEDILAGKYVFFSSTKFDLGLNYDWVSNPDTGYKYDINKHWIDINDYTKEAGDIKYVWEKSRFTYLNTLIRYDFYFDIDLSEFVFSEIENWVDNNPINYGPNYKCSQEISLRSFNWIFALNYYKNSVALTDKRFDKIMHVLYWHAKHVYENINFSRIAVRNNHAITECLGIYTFGLLFPFFPESSKWKALGKKWFEEEIAYQIYEDGTFLQFSMNYHRVVIQLLTWAFEINRKNDSPFSEIVYDRAIKSHRFLMSCMNPINGMLPNYGANDGALFFKWGCQEFRDFRPQLDALGMSLGLKSDKIRNEDCYWFGFQNRAEINVEFNPETLPQLKSFEVGGYYTIRDVDDTFTFIRCGSHKDRPSQADNLHVDIWQGGDNILRDAGSYKYNTDDLTLKYFFGTKSHNTVGIGSNDQMIKGGRFIWYNWTQSNLAKLEELSDCFVFDGEISAFRSIDKNIVHKRKVVKYKKRLKWIITDEVIHDTAFPIQQYWHPNEKFWDEFEMKSFDEKGMPLEPLIETGYYSGLYGQKEEIKQVCFSTNSDSIITTIIKK
jgi:hypothetical protein